MGDSLALTILAIGVILLIRSQLMYLHAQRAIEFIYSQENCHELHKYLDIDRLFNRTLYSVTKWTYRQVLPELARLEESVQ